MQERLCGLSIYYIVPEDVELARSTRQLLGGGEKMTRSILRPLRHISTGTYCAYDICIYAWLSIKIYLELQVPIQSI